ncbi:TIGR03790 family protein [Actomonas aquatica]|uniref:TIGR03790 family protein n=1 Tax=Actomonas aquatica TaxID=2866162 RepID=A0ABZ1CD79_9BACT|nr:TIGR03790 family protein [Opitutus sp. WL0086]WRQ89213.1 TIGR03790 family protein [Opitutus sp. WL0086]
MPDEAERVVIVANANDPDSVQLARFYADERAIPRANIVALDLPAGEEISWPIYVTQLLEPLRSWLIEHDWLQAVPMNLVDDAGRTRMSISSHRISYLVTVRGVPLKIRQSDEIPSDGPESDRQAVRTNRAAVDSELAVLAVNESRRHGYLPNRLFQKNRPDLWERGSVVRVARLDGPSYPAARNLVESALIAERRGLIGRAIVDIGGPHKLGDTWFGDTEKALTAAGWAPQVDREKSTFPAEARADGVAWYMGWYTSRVNGPFLPPDYEFAPGAIALHLHSFSASSLRSLNNGGWVGPLVGRGVAATFGNVYEPYLEFTHRPQHIVRALLAGATLGEAAYFSIPVLSWQSVVIGDPLYRPSAVSFEAQWAARDELPGRFASYLGLRQLGMMAMSEAPMEERLALANGVMAKHPSLAMALAQAQLKEAAGDRAGALRALGLVAYMRRVRADERGLVITISRQLVEWEDPATALKAWGNLLNQELPKEQRVAWLREAVTVARAAGEFSQAADWEQEITLLTTDVKN